VEHNTIVEEKEAKLAFRRFDSDASGGIDRREFRRCLRALGRPASRREANALFKHIDVDQSGEIDEAEFVSWYLADGVAFLGGTTSESDAEGHGPRRANAPLPPAANDNNNNNNKGALVVKDADDVEAAGAAGVLDTRQFEQAVVKCWSVTLTLINDFQGRAQPFAEMRLVDVDVEAKGWSSPRLQVCYVAVVLCICFVS
jgi:hypothetical protein